MTLRIASLLLTLFCCLTVTSAQAAPQLIKELEFRGNVRMADESLRSLVRLRPGRLLKSDQLSADIRTLHQTGKFSDIQVYQEPVTAGIRLVYQLEEIPKIQEVLLKGNKEVSAKKLYEVIPIKKYDLALPSVIAESEQAIREHYASKGYHLVEVDHEFLRDGGKDTKLQFIISENAKVHIKRIRFRGNRAFSDKELRKVINSKEKTLFSALSGKGKYQRDMLDNDTGMLTYHYLSAGYLDVMVSAPEVYLTRDKKWLMVYFDIEEGKPYDLGSVSVEGDILTSEAELLSLVKSQAGDRYSRRQVDADMLALRDFYGEQAYAFANIRPLTRKRPGELIADLTFVIDRGEKIKIERINITGNTVTRDKVIRRELEVVENGYFRASDLRRSQQKLMALGFFENVSIATPRGSRDDTIVLNIEVIEKSTGTFSIGAGFSSVENFVFTASLSKENFLGYGVSGQFSVELSSLRQLFLLSYQDPYFLDSNWILGINGYRTINVFDDFDRESMGGSFSLGRRFLRHFRLHAAYNIEDVEINDLSAGIPNAFADTLSGLTSSASVTLSYDTRDNRLYPTKGLFLSTTHNFAGLGGDTRYYEVTGNGRFYYPLFKGVIFRQNATIQFLKSLENERIPLYTRYFTGGINSLRGYRLRSVGPSVRSADHPAGGDQQFFYGGNKLLLFNSELEFPVFGDFGIKLVAFYDVGNAYDESESYDLSNLRHSYGFGLRWNSPLGPMRFEWGIPINKRPGDDAYVFNFTIGNFF